MSKAEIEIVSAEKAIKIMAVPRSVFYHKHRINLKQATKVVEMSFTD
jgi:dUTPase